MKDKDCSDELVLQVASTGATDLTATDLTASASASASASACEQPVDGTASAKTDYEDPLVGTKLAERYQILLLIGRGATSCVYKAEDLVLSRPVAVKILHSHLASDVETVRRFEQEVKTASVLKHANAVPIYDRGITKTGQPFLVMELVEGQTLTDMIQQGAGLELKRAVNIFVQVCACLAAAHERGIIHRDLKPGNLMISTDANGKDFVRVLDFGIAKVLPVQGETFQRLTQSGEMLGSLLYMSPEQCLDEDLDGRSDVYSLGCLMYETFTGKPPLCGRTAFETMNKHLTDMPEKLNRVRPDLNLPDAVEQIVFKSIAKKPEHRYQTILEVEDALKVLLGESISKLIQAPVEKPYQLGTSTTALTNASSIAEQARMAVRNARKEVHDATTFFYFFCVLVVALITCTVVFHWDWVFLFLLLVPWAIFPLFSLGSIELLPMIERAAFVVQNCLPMKVLIRKVNQSGGEGSHNYKISLGTENNLAESASIEVRIKHASQPFWNSMAVASQLEDLSSRNISVDVYTDPENGKPVALAIKGELVFVKRGNV